MHHDLRAESLDESHRGAQPLVGRGVGGELDILEVLRSDTDDHLTAVVATQRGALRRDRVRQGDRLRADGRGDPIAGNTNTPFVEVHRR